MPDKIDKYFNGIISMADKASERSLSAMDIFDKRSDEELSSLADDLIKIRSLFISDSDRERCAIHIELGFGYFAGYDGDMKIAAYSALFDLEDELSVINLRKKCVPYSKSQVLFQQIPDLWNKVRVSGDRDPELINISGMKWDETGQLALFKNKKAKLNDYLLSGIVVWLRTRYDNNKLFARLDPHNASSDLAPSLNEAVVRPIDPEWWKDLSI